jgi:hypothetical protein
MLQQDGFHRFGSERAYGSIQERSLSGCESNRSGLSARVLTGSGENLVDFVADLLTARRFQVTHS